MTYVIDWSDSNKTPILVDPLTKDETSSPIIIYGKGYSNYGERIQENLLHLLENFAADAPPANPVEGMLWFDNINLSLYVYDGGGFVEIGSSNATVSAVPPTGASAGDFWFNTNDLTLYVYNGSTWDSYTKKADFDDHVANVDASSQHIDAVDRAFLDNTSTSTVTAADLDNVKNTTAPVQTQLNERVQKAGDTMTGFLTLHDNPVNDFHATPKTYVDTAIFDAINAVFQGNVQYKYNNVHSTFLQTGDTVISLPFVYETGKNELQVFVSGSKIPNTEFSETNTSTVTLNSAISADDTSVFVFRTRVAPPILSGTPTNSSVTIINEYVDIATASQSIFTIQAGGLEGTNNTDFDLTSGRSTIMVYVNNIFQTDYTVTGTNEITFGTGLTSGAVVNVVQYVSNTGGTVNPTIVSETFVAGSDNTTVVNLSTHTYYYDPNTPIDPQNTAILVFVENVAQTYDAIGQISGSSITLSQAINTGDTVVIYMFKLVEGVQE